MNKVLEFIENFGTRKRSKEEAEKRELVIYKVLTTILGIVLIMIAFIAAAFVLSISGTSGKNGNPVKEAVCYISFIGTFELLYYSFLYIERLKKLKRKPKNIISKRLYKRLYIIYVAICTVIEMIIEVYMWKSEAEFIVLILPIYVCCYIAFLLLLGFCQYFLIILDNMKAGLIISFAIGIGAAVILHYCLIALAIMIFGGFVVLCCCLGQSRTRFFKHIGGGMYIEF